MAHYEINRFGNDDYIEYAKHKDFSFPPHFHRCLEFIYMFEGEMNMIYNTKKLTLKAGDAALFLPNEIHGYENKNNSSFASLVFSPELVGPFIKQVEGKKANNPQFFIREKFLVDEILDFKKVLLNTLKVKGILLLICGSFLEQVEWVQTTNSNESLSHKIIDYIGNNFREDISLKTMATTLGYDSCYLSRFVSKNMHTTFQQYLTELRLAYAVDLLCKSKEKIVNVAMKSGFSCIRTFNGVFKKAYGVSPSQYVKSISNSYLQ